MGNMEGGLGNWDKSGQGEGVCQKADASRRPKKVWKLGAITDNEYQSNNPLFYLIHRASYFLQKEELHAGLLVIFLLTG